MHDEQSHAHDDDDKKAAGETKAAGDKKGLFSLE